MDVDQRLLRFGDVEQAVAAARGLAEPGPEEEQEVGVAHAVAERRCHRNADVAGVAAMRVVEIVLAPEGDADRQLEPLGERLEVGASSGVPTAAAENHERPPGRREQSAQARHVVPRGMRLDRLVADGIGSGRGLGQHVLGQCYHHRPGPARGRGVERAGDHLRDARRLIDLADPLGDAREHLPVVDLLERFAPAHLARDLADEKDHRGRVLACDVHPVAAVGGTRTAGHHGDAGPPRELAVGLGHHGGAALLTADDVADLAVVERVEQPEIALAGHAEGHVHTVDLELVDQDPTAGAQVGGAGHAAPSSASGQKASSRSSAAE